MVPDCELSECALAMRQHLNRLDQVGLLIDDVVVILAPQYHVETPGISHALSHRPQLPASRATEFATGQRLGFAAPGCLKGPWVHHQLKTNVVLPWLKKTMTINDNENVKLFGKTNLVTGDQSDSETVIP